MVLPQAVANQIRVAAYRWTLRRFRPYQVRRSWAGYPFDLWISDPTSESWYDHDSPEIPSEMSFLAQHRLRVGKTVGAAHHHGGIAAELAHFGGDFVELALGARRQQHLAAERRQRQRRGAAKRA